MITFDELPQAAKDYVTTNSSQDSVRRIVKVTAADGTVKYIVALTNGTILIFDESGVLLETKTKVDRHVEVLFTDLPQAVQDSINAKFDVTKSYIFIK